MLVPQPLRLVAPVVGIALPMYVFLVKLLESIVRVYGVGQMSRSRRGQHSAELVWGMYAVRRSRAIRLLTHYRS
jgi:hypothetical protein